MITLELYGNPVPQARPRVCRRGSKITAYDPKYIEKKEFQWQIQSQHREEALTVPVSLDLIFYMPIPKSTSGIKTRQMQNGLIGHIKKPDIDNLIKFVLDCMNKIVFADDSQVSEIRAKKIYSSKPGTLIRVIPQSDEKRQLLYENCARENR